MPTSFHSYKGRFQRLIYEFLWNQWSALGVAGHQVRDDDRMIDPEALLLFTTSFARGEPRLFDEVLDWLTRQADIINLQRLKNLQSTYTLGQTGVLAVIAASVGQRPANLKWRALAKELIAPEKSKQGNSLHKKWPEYSIPETPEPFFYDVPVISKPDELFLGFGWLRDKLQLRGLSTLPDPHRPANLLIKLRALVGIQARAEMMACLLGSENSHPAQIAKATGYFPRTVQLALNEMARSGHLFFTKEAREKHFHLEKEDWRFLIGKSEARFPRWINWGPFFALLEATLRKLNTPGFDSSSPTIQAIELRSVLDEALLDSALRREVQPSPNLKGEEMLAAFIESFERLLIPSL